MVLSTQVFITNVHTTEMYTDYQQHHQFGDPIKHGSDDWFTAKPVQATAALSDKILWSRAIGVWHKQYTSRLIWYFSCMHNLLTLMAFFAVFLLNSQQAQAEVLRVNPEWLRANLDRPDLVIIDSRAAPDYEISHIRNALNLPDKLTYQHRKKSGRIVEPDMMQKLLRERGIDNSKMIIIYDGGQIMDASRLFWTLEVYGLQKVKILSPGFETWVSKQYPLSSESPKVKPSTYTITVDHKRIASKFSTQLATANPNQIVVDARKAEAYAGKSSTAKRSGHIPTAINIPITHLIEEKNGTKVLKDQEALKQLYSGLPKDKKVILYCEIGRASSTTYLTLRELGYDVSNYDASWREWGNDFSLPIEK